MTAVELQRQILDKRKFGTDSPLELPNDELNSLYNDLSELMQRSRKLDWMEDKYGYFQQIY